MKLAFIGIGLMGAPMARRLVEAGHDVALWNRNRDKLAPLVARGAQAAASPADAARGAEIVMLCVTDAAAVDAVVFGPAGVAESIAPPASTATPITQSDRASPVQLSPSSRSRGR
jgi:3-hydroxyisobutyrate dehydrogenase